MRSEYHAKHVLPKIYYGIFILFDKINIKHYNYIEIYKINQTYTFKQPEYNSPLTS